MLHAKNYFQSRKQGLIPLGSYIILHFSVLELERENYIVALLLVTASFAFWMLAKEHITDPRKVIGEFRKKLRTAGSLIGALLLFAGVPPLLITILAFGAIENPEWPIQYLMSLTEKVYLFSGLLGISTIILYTVHRYLRHKDFSGFFDFWSDNLVSCSTMFVFVPSVYLVLAKSSLEFVESLIFVIVAVLNWHFRRFATLRSCGVVLVLSLLLLGIVVLGLQITPRDSENMGRLYQEEFMASQAFALYFRDLKKVTAGEIETNPIIFERVNGSLRRMGIDFSMMNSSYSVISEKALSTKKALGEFESHIRNANDSLEEVRSRDTVFKPIFDAHNDVLIVMDRGLHLLDLALNTTLLTIRMYMNESQVSEQVIEQAETLNRGINEINIVVEDMSERPIIGYFAPKGQFLSPDLPMSLEAMALVRSRITATPTIKVMDSEGGKLLLQLSNQANITIKDCVVRAYVMPETFFTIKNNTLRIGNFSAPELRLSWEVKVSNTESFQAPVQVMLEIEGAVKINEDYCYVKIPFYFKLLRIN